MDMKNLNKLVQYAYLYYNNYTIVLNFRVHCVCIVRFLRFLIFLHLTPLFIYFTGTADILPKQAATLFKVPKPTLRKVSRSYQPDDVLPLLEMIKNHGTSHVTTERCVSYGIYFQRKQLKNLC